MKAVDPFQSLSAGTMTCESNGGCMTPSGGEGGCGCSGGCGGRGDGKCRCGGSCGSLGGGGRGASDGIAANVPSIPKGGATPPTGQEGVVYRILPPTWYDKAV